jgi:inorganic pyrophosphatase
MAFPYDFGFVPSTKAEDGDPVDVLVLMDEPAFPGCLLQCRVIGVIEGEEASKKEKVRNDRIVAVEKANHSFGNVDHIHELGKKFVKELEEFFVNYHALSGKKYGVLDVKGPTKALRRSEVHRANYFPGQRQASPSVSAMTAPRIPSGFSCPTVVSRAV